MDRIELVGTLRDDVAFDRLFEPGPLKHRRLENRGRGVGVIFQQLCRAVSAETQVQPAIEAAVVAAPAFRNQRPERFRYLQPAQKIFVVDGMADQLEAHRVDLGGGRLDLAFDLIEREDRRCAASTAATVSTMAVPAVTVTMQPARRAAKAAIGGAAIHPPVGPGHGLIARPAIPSRRQPHRDRTDRGTSHQCQHHPARAFHGCDPCCSDVSQPPVSITNASGCKRKPGRFTASCSGSAAGEMSGEGMRKRAEAAALHAARTRLRSARVARRGIARGRSP